METLIEAFAEAMASVGRGVEARFEREQVEFVFGLTGGELDDEPIEFFLLPRERWEHVNPVTRHYTYDGVPEWAGSDFPDKYDSGVSYFTIVEAGIDYGSILTEAIQFADGKVWVKVEQYVHSGETECPAGSCGDDETVGEDSTEGFAECPLCGEKAGEKHGYIYVGPGAETVYKRIDVACAECGLTRGDIEEPDTDDLCGCAFDADEE